MDWTVVWCVGISVVFLCAMSIVEIVKKAKALNAAKTDVVRTVLVDSSHTATSRTKATSAAARGAVGGMLLGPVGLVAGAASGKNKVTEKHETTFLVYYLDGTRKTEKVANNTKFYDLYMEKLDDRQFVKE